MGAYWRGGVKNHFATGYILSEILLPIRYFLMLQIQAIRCFLEDTRHRKQCCTTIFPRGFPEVGCYSAIKLH